MSFLTAIEEEPAFSTPKTSPNCHFRTFSTAEMWERIQPFLPQAGITRLADISGLDWLGLPVWTAIRPNSYSLSVSQGKGQTAADARLGAAMEALEGFVAERATLEIRRAAYNELLADGERALDPLSLPRLEDSLYHPDSPLNWARGYDLLAGGTIWAPAQMVDLDLRINRPEPTCFLRSSNGLASGGAIAEALYHALLELLERDAWTIFTDTVKTGDFHRYQCDLTTITQEETARLLETLWQKDFAPVLLDISSDVALPAYLCLLFENPSCQRPLQNRSCFMGTGCDHNPYSAMEQAILEAVQGRLTLISGSRDDFTRNKYENSYSQDMRQLQSLFVPRGRGGRDCRQLPQYGQTTLGGDIRYALGELEKIGLPGLAFYDLSRPGWPFKVVRLIAPLLETAFHIPGITRGPRMQHFRELRHGN